MRIIIYGDCASKANSRRVVFVNGRIRVIKSNKALQFERYSKLQLQAFHLKPITVDVRIMMTIYYPSNRNDLDESLVLDVLQGHAYLNDRQVREKHIYHAIDRKNPRVIIEVEKL